MGDTTKALETTLAILGTIMKMSDHAESLGAARSLSGIAALHTMQQSIQKNGPRLAKIVADLQETGHGRT